MRAQISPPWIDALASGAVSLDLTEAKCATADGVEFNLTVSAQAVTIDP